MVKLSKHIATVHKNLPEVKNLNAIKPKKREKGKKLDGSQRERKNILSTFRKDGNFKHNKKAKVGDPFLAPRRSRKKKGKKYIDEYAPCPKCKDQYIKKTLHKHVAVCTKLSGKTNHSVQSMSALVQGNHHDEASPLYVVVISKLRQDLVGITCRHDLVIVLFGNLDAFKNRAHKHLNRMVRAKIRRLAGVVILMRKFCKEVTDLASFLKPTYYDTCIQVVNRMGKYNEKIQLFEHLATAEAVGMLMTEVCKMWSIECVKRNLPEKKVEVDLFLKVHELEFNKKIGKTVSESQAEMARTKKIELPSARDVQKLHYYLQTKRRAAYNDLMENGFSINSFYMLLETTLISIQMFNRRRAGEIERLKRVHFELLEKLDEKSHPELYQQLGSASKKYLQKYSRMLIRGKKNRTVPILLTDETRDCINCILMFRKDLKIDSNNPFIFALPSNDKKEHKFASACVILRKLSTQCSVNQPHLLRGTIFRRHVATVCMNYNLNDNQIDDLANFMGHHDKIHREHYRQPLAQRDIINVAQLLEKAQGIYDESNPELEVEETDSESENIEANDEQDDLAGPSNQDFDATPKYDSLAKNLGKVNYLFVL